MECFCKVAYIDASELFDLVEDSKWIFVTLDSGLNIEFWKLSHQCDLDCLAMN